VRYKYILVSQLRSFDVRKKIYRGVGHDVIVQPSSFVSN